MSVQIGDTSKHTRGCDALTPGEACTCSLEYRRAWETERTLHNAWRKRGEDAEAALAATPVYKCQTCGRVLSNDCDTCQRDWSS